MPFSFSFPAQSSTDITPVISSSILGLNLNPHLGATGSLQSIYDDYEHDNESDHDLGYDPNMDQLSNRNHRCDHNCDHRLSPHASHLDQSHAIKSPSMESAKFVKIKREEHGHRHNSFLAQSDVLRSPYVGSAKFVKIKGEEQEFGLRHKRTNSQDDDDWAPHADASEPIPPKYTELKRKRGTGAEVEGPKKPAKLPKLSAKARKAAAAELQSAKATRKEQNTKNALANGKQSKAAKKNKEAKIRQANTHKDPYPLANELLTLTNKFASDLTQLLGLHQ